MTSRAMSAALWMLTACGPASFQLGDEHLDVGQRVGLTQRTESRVEGAVALEGGGSESIVARQGMRYRATARVLDVLDGGASKVSVHFDSASAWLAMPSRGLDQPEHDLPIATKTFTVELGASPAVRSTDSIALDPSLESVVASAAQTLAARREGQLRSCIPSETIPVGTSVDLSACHGAIFAGQGFDVVASSLVLSALTTHDGRSAGDFALAMTLTGTGTEVELSGQMVLDVRTGHILRMAVDGPMTMAGSPTGVSASGTLSMEQTLHVLEAL